MITLAPGRAVGQLLDRATIRPELYAEVTLCSPYIDETLACRVRALVNAAKGPSCGVTVITAPAGARQLYSCFRPSAVPRLLRIIVRRNLHTKTYVMVARMGSARSEALVTSANLTAAALSKNEELGIRIVGNSPGGRALMAQLTNSLRRLTAASSQRHL